MPDDLEPTALTDSPAAPPLTDPAPVDPAPVAAIEPVEAAPEPAPVEPMDTHFDPSPDVPDRTSADFAAFSLRGHAIITESMARAKQLGESYPAVRALVPLMEAALHDLLNHLLSDPQPVAVAPVEPAAPAQD